MTALNSMQMSEARTIAKCVAGDPLGFEALYHRHKRQVYTLCHRIVNSADVAEKLTYEAFMQAFRTISSFGGEMAFSAWLIRLTLSLILNYLQNKTQAEVALNEPKQEDTQEKQPGEEGVHLIRSLDRVTLEESSTALPQVYKIVLILHDIEGFQHNEIAEMMNSSVADSKAQLHKARMKLRLILENKQVKRQSSDGLLILEDRRLSTGDLETGGGGSQVRGRLDGTASA